MKQSPYERLATLPVEDVVARIGLPPHANMMSYKKNPLKLYSLRMRTFKQSGTMCVSCGANASYFAVERHRKGTPTKYHLNLYGVIDGEEVMFTCDHIIALSNGGEDNLSNTQTMCTTCNNKKGNK